MLSELITLNKASISLTTNENGQINLALFSDGKEPLVLTFTQDNVHSAEQEIKAYCNGHSLPTSASNTATSTDDLLQEFQL